MKKLDNNRGGAREGAGRKAGKTQTPMLLKLDNDLLPYVQAQSNKNRYINTCIRKANGLD